jgi:two-component system, OmpR family, sensor kinase
MTLPIRVRLTLWYVFMLALTLLLFAAGLYAFVAREERQSIDATLRERAVTFTRGYDSEANEGPSEKAAAEAARDFARGEGDAFAYDRNGRLIARSDAAGNPGSTPIVLAAFAEARAGRSRMVTVDRDTRCIVAPLGQDYVVVITQSLAREAAALSRLRQAMAIAIPAALVVAAAIGYLLALRSLAPVSRMTEVASRIEAENLSERVDFAHPSDELGRLGTVLNALLERLEQSFEQQKRLLADTSHELRTPVTIIRSEAEVTLSRERSDTEYRDALEIIRSEATHLTYLIDSVLLLARADARQNRIATETFSLNDVTQQSVHALRTVAERLGIDLSCGTNGPMPMRGDAELIRRMLLNLLDNAIKFTDRGGKVRLDVNRAGDAYLIRVSDTGRGIPPEAQAHIFDRFYRADRARNRKANREDASGAGLGLSIARWIAEAHGGDVRLMQSSSAGSIFEATVRDVSG